MRDDRRVRQKARKRFKHTVYLVVSGVIGFMIIVSLFLPSIDLGQIFGSRSTGARVGDHWHASLLVEICGTEITLPEVGGGIHTHGDNAIHIEPQFPSEARANANLARFFDSFPMVMESDSIQAPEGELYQNGQSCPDDQPGTVQVDNSVAECALTVCTAAEELAIFTAVNATVPRSDAVDGDVVSNTGANIDAGDGNVANLQLDINADRVWAILFSVKMP